MFVTIWMCTHEWSDIPSRCAFIPAAYHQPLICSSALTASTSAASLRLPRVGTLISAARIALAQRDARLRLAHDAPAASACAPRRQRHQLALHAARLLAVARRVARPACRRAAAPRSACCRRGSARACRAARRAAPGRATGATSSTRLSRLRGIRSAEPM